MFNSSLIYIVLFPVDLMGFSSARSLEALQDPVPDDLIYPSLPICIHLSLSPSVSLSPQGSSRLR